MANTKFNNNHPRLNVPQTKPGVDQGPGALLNDGLLEASIKHLGSLSFFFRIFTQ
jgi:hypothetical protein